MIPDIPFSEKNRLEMGGFPYSLYKGDFGRMEKGDGIIPISLL